MSILRCLVCLLTVKGKCLWGRDRLPEGVNGNVKIFTTYDPSILLN